MMSENPIVVNGLELSPTVEISPDNMGGIYIYDKTDVRRVVYHTPDPSVIPTVIPALKIDDDRPITDIRYAQKGDVHTDILVFVELVAGVDRVVRVIRFSSGEVKWSRDLKMYFSIDFLSTGEFVYVTTDKSISCFDVDTGSVRTILMMDAFPFVPQAVMGISIDDMLYYKHIGAPVRRKSLADPCAAPPTTVGALPAVQFVSKNIGIDNTIVYSLLNE